MYQKELNLALNDALLTPVQGYIAANEGMRTRPNRKHILTENDFKKLIIVGKNDPVLDSKTSLTACKYSFSPGCFVSKFVFIYFLIYCLI